MSRPRLPGFVLLRSYVAATRGLFTDADQRELEAILTRDPESGAVIEGTGGVRKLRMPLEGRGKRGGARVVYYYRRSIGRIYLLTVYAKNEKANLTRAERNAMKALTARLEAE